MAQLFSLVLLLLYLTTVAFAFTSTVATRLHQAGTIMHMNMRFSAEDTKIISGLFSYSRQNWLKKMKFSIN